MQGFRKGQCLIADTKKPRSFESRLTKNWGELI